MNRTKTQGAGGDMDEETSLEASRPELHTFCKYGKLDMVKTLLTKGLDINLQDDNGCTGLYEAVRYNQLETARYLLHQGANPNLVNNHGFTPLHRACMDKRTDMVKLLLQYNCHINQVCTKTGSALHIATLYKSEPILDILLAKGADTNVLDHNRMTSLHVLCTMSNPIPKTKLESESESIDKSILIARKLLSYGTRVNDEDVNGRTSLHTATYRGLEEMVKLLCEFAGDANVRDRAGQTALHIASQHGNQPIVHCLLKEGADPNVQDHKGDTPLHKAAQRNQKQIIDILLQYGSDVARENSKGQTALHCACASNSDVTILDSLLVCGADVNVPDGEVNRPVHVCSKYNHHQLLQKLIHYGANVNDRDRQGRTPVFIACQQGHRQIVDILIDGGADLSIGDSRGRSPLHQICEAGFVYVDLVSRLLSHEPGLVRLADSDGRTPLIVACQAKLFNDRAVSLLVKASNDIVGDDQDKTTAFTSILASCNRLLPFIGTDSEKAIDQRLQTLDELFDSGGAVQDINDSIMTSSFPKLNDFLMRSASTSSTRISTPLIERLMQSPDSMRVLVDCGYRLDDGAMSTIREGDQYFSDLMSPPSLMSQSRNAIRQCIRQTRGSMRHNIHNLPIPKRLQDYVNFDY